MESRVEDILRATIDQTQYDTPPESRLENLLIELKEAIGQGGGSSQALEVEAEVQVAKDQFDTNSWQDYAVFEVDVPTDGNKMLVFENFGPLSEYGDFYVYMNVLVDGVEAPNQAGYRGIYNKGAYYNNLNFISFFPMTKGHHRINVIVSPLTSFSVQDWAKSQIKIYAFGNVSGGGSAQKSMDV